MDNVSVKDIEDFIKTAANSNTSWNNATNFVNKQKIHSFEIGAAKVGQFTTEQKKIIAKVIGYMKSHPDVSRMQAMEDLKVKDFGWSIINITAKRADFALGRN